MNNFNDMMKKAQEMQKKMQEMQESLSSLEVEGTSGGGMVKVVMNCKNEIKKIDIDQSIINKDEKEVMEDLVVAALNDAKTSFNKPNPRASANVPNAVAIFLSLQHFLSLVIYFRCGCFLKSLYR